MFHTATETRWQRKLLVAVAIAMSALIVSGCTRGDSSNATPVISVAPTFEGPSVGYVRATWNQDLHVQCASPETRDNGGADSAVIEIWGPTEDGRYRADMIAPNGRTETVIADVAEDGTIIESWGTYQLVYPPSTGKSFDALTAFRIVDCVTETGNSTARHSVSDGPYTAGRLPFPQP